jgi:aminoglycoside/choline kinase family phosphotransferase
MHFERALNRSGAAGGVGTMPRLLLYLAQAHPEFRLADVTACCQLAVRKDRAGVSVL